jgi:peptidoglycan hydrolase CwlO-like protein
VENDCHTKDNLDSLFDVACYGSRFKIRDSGEQTMILTIFILIGVAFLLIFLFAEIQSRKNSQIDYEIRNLYDRVEKLEKEIMRNVHKVNNLERQLVQNRRECVENLDKEAVRLGFKLDHKEARDG